MSETPHQDLSGVAETSLITLYLRAMESQRPDALIKHEKAVALVARMGDAIERIKGFPMTGESIALATWRSQEFDRRTRDFLAAHPNGIVVSIGCGLDTRFDRVAERNGTVTWYDLDLPEVIALRRQLLAETPRCRFIGCSVLDFARMDLVGGDAKRPCLFLAEGVFPYFGAAEVRRVVLALQERFPGTELVFDAMTPFMASLHSRHTAICKLHAHLWGIKRGKELEAWSPGIRLLSEWFYFDQPEPRLGRTRLLRFVALLNKGSSVVHYQLG